MHMERDGSEYDDKVYIYSRHILFLDLNKELEKISNKKIQTIS